MRARATYHHGDLPRTLRDAARTLLTEVGADAFTLREAARRVGVTHTAAYRHYPDKRALLAAIAEEGFQRLGRRMQRELRGLPPGDVRTRLQRIAEAYVEFARAEPAVFGLMTGPRLNEDRRFPSLEEALEATVAVVVDTFQDGQRRGLVRRGAATDQAMALLSLLQGYVAFVAMRRIHVRPARTAEYLQTLLAPLLDGLASR